MGEKIKGTKFGRYSFFFKMRKLPRRKNGVVEKKKDFSPEALQFYFFIFFCEQFGSSFK